ncbi:hypothetical protein DFH07DRAFT_1035978 [Mycena maculata]|uniref:Uncharacterized protein n=1 Tax=Mycena maculata TaxID=230809 RepID=A0AAD7K3W5_9AGAR|nr:hypothetical protein DFH07DRAFT_1035978 [Mycena maculata]
MSGQWYAAQCSSYAGEQQNSDPVQDAHALLTIYPMTSANPSTHEYAPEVDYLASQGNESGYWENACNRASILVSQQAGSSYPYPNAYTPANAHLSTFCTNPFAQAILQRWNPATTYPIPPPLSSSSTSSSLAHAFGPAPPSPQMVYEPQQSPAFFNQFIAQKSQEISAQNADP